MLIVLDGSFGGICHTWREAVSELGFSIDVEEDSDPGYFRIVFRHLVSGYNDDDLPSVQCEGTWLDIAAREYASKVFLKEHLLLGKMKAYNKAREGVKEVRLFDVWDGKIKEWRVNPNTGLVELCTVKEFV